MLQSAWYFEIMKRSEVEKTSEIYPDDFIFFDWVLKIKETSSPTRTLSYKIDPSFTLSASELTTIYKGNKATWLECGFISIAQKQLPPVEMEKELMALLLEVGENRGDLLDLIARSHELIGQLKKFWKIGTSSPRQIPSRNEVMRVELCDELDFVIESYLPTETQGSGIHISECPKLNWGVLSYNLPKIAIDYINLMSVHEEDYRRTSRKNVLLKEIQKMEKELESKQEVVVGTTTLPKKSNHYNYLVLFQDLIAPQSIPMACRWVGSFEVEPLYNVTVWRSPAENFGLMFSVDSNVELDAVKAGAQGKGLAARLSALAVQPLDSKHPEYDQICEQFRAVFE